MPDASPEKADSNYVEDLALLTRAVEAAGEIALRYFRNGARHWLKEGDSPVTEADMAVDAYLLEQLSAARPAYGWLSEESVNDHARLECRRVFVVDPIDGTRGFIKRSDEWTICAAVVEEGRSVAAIVHNPMRGEMFAAVRGGGARCNDKPISVTSAGELSGARICAAKRAVEPLGEVSGSLRHRYCPSLAYRFALTACGEVDATVSAGHAHEWDVAAAGLIVEEAGGCVTHLDGALPVFNKATPRVPPIIAAGPPLHAAMRAAFDQNADA
ncbi:3'(2'),5'-bisphosphate nucleotidase CysQ [Tepidamorphus sp. 3E244]|uniref:3'(2'),5'-bisphosphate nucleotidase CysQ n=1 Tax=Tepidamorphus sp. 3E244 TaxID=3385498 RepID=UPI0038FBEB93